MTLAHIAFGRSGPPVIVLHGLFGQARNWATVGKRLGEHFRVFALDLRNHGTSPHRETMTYPEMAADVAAFMTGHGLEQAMVIGHSMGGKTAMVLALEHPALVERLMVVDIAPVASGNELSPYVEAMRAVDLDGLERRSQADEALAEAVPDAGVRAFLLQNLETRDGRLAWKLNLKAIGAGMTDITGFPDSLLDRRYDGPALFLGGARSPYIKPEHAPLISRLFPRAKIDAIPGAGHWVHAEKPDAFVTRALAFLQA